MSKRPQPDSYSEEIAGYRHAPHNLDHGGDAGSDEVSHAHDYIDSGLFCPSRRCGHKVTYLCVLCLNYKHWVHRVLSRYGNPAVLAVMF